MPFINPLARPSVSTCGFENEPMRTNSPPPKPVKSQPLPRSLSCDVSRPGSQFRGSSVPGTTTPTLSASGGMFPRTKSTFLDPEKREYYQPVRSLSAPRAVNPGLGPSRSFSAPRAEIPASPHSRSLSAPQSFRQGINSQSNDQVIICENCSTKNLLPRSATHFQCYGCKVKKQIIDSNDFVPGHGTENVRNTQIPGHVQYAKDFPGPSDYGGCFSHEEVSPASMANRLSPLRVGGCQFQHSDNMSSQLDGSTYLDFEEYHMPLVSGAVPHRDDSFTTMPRFGNTATQVNNYSFGEETMDTSVARSSLPSIFDNHAQFDAFIEPMVNAAFSMQKGNYVSPKYLKPDIRIIKEKEQGFVDNKNSLQFVSEKKIFKKLEEKEEFEEEVTFGQSRQHAVLFERERSASEDSEQLSIRPEAKERSTGRSITREKSIGRSVSRKQSPRNCTSGKSSQKLGKKHSGRSLESEDSVKMNQILNNYNRSSIDEGVHDSGTSDKGSRDSIESEFQEAQVFGAPRDPRYFAVSEDKVIANMKTNFHETEGQKRQRVMFASLFNGFQRKDDENQMGNPSLIIPDAGSFIDEKTLQLVMDSGPLLIPYAARIGTHFFRLLFQRYPHYCQIMNMSDYENGTLQISMTNSLCAIATNLNNFTAIMSGLREMHHRNCAMGIKPIHWAEFGTTFIETIKMILPIPDVTLAAYDLAIKTICNLFANQEAELYKKAKIRGWEGFRDMMLVRKKRITKDFSTFVFESDDFVNFRPGQYLTVKIPGPDLGTTVLRHYIATSRPGEPWLSCTIQKTGYSSSYLFDTLEVGHTIPISVPFGAHNLNLQGYHVFISCGIGFTSNRAKLQSLPDPRLVAIAHLARSENEIILTERVNAQKLLLTLTEGQHVETNRWITSILRSSLLEKWDPRLLTFHVCGPNDWIKEVVTTLKLHGPADIVTQYFSPNV